MGIQQDGHPMYAFVLARSEFSFLWRGSGPLLCGEGMMRSYCPENLVTLDLTYGSSRNLAFCGIAYTNAYIALQPLLFNDSLE